jgi:hypothetical protein
MAIKLYIQPKTIIFAARVNEPAEPTPPYTEVTYDTVTTGAYGVVGVNQTVLIGSSAGAWDLGITRIRLDPTSSKLYIGRSSKGARLGEVTLTDNAYLSVLSEAPRVWSKVPFIGDDGVSYYDADLSFDDYGDRPPVANAGPAVIGTIDGGSGKLAVNFSAAASFAVMPGASIVSYAWNLGSGGSFTGGTSLSDVDIETEFDPGHHVVTVDVADDNAQVHRAYVNVVAIDPDDDPCIYNFEIESHRITPEGQELQLRIREDIPEATYLAGAWCCLWDGEPGDADDRSNVVFQGWLEFSDEEIGSTATGLLRDVSLTLLDVAGRLKLLPGYSTVIEHAASPANWQEFTTPTMAIMLHTLLHYQSTALSVADFTFAGDEDDYTYKILSSDGDSIWDQVRRRAEALIPDHLVVCNRLGQLAVKVDQMLLDTGDRTSSSQGTLTPDYYSDIRYRVQRNPRVNWLRSNSILAGTTGVATAFCIAPGTSPGWGSAQVDDGEHLALTQDDLNAVTGHRYARLNSEYGPFSITLAEGADLGLEPAALTWLKVTIDAATAAQRGLTFTEARFLMRQLDIRYNHTPTGLTKTVTITAERETVGLPATTVTVPTAEAVDNGGWTPANPVPDPAFNHGLTVGQDVVGFITRSGQIYTCSDFTSPGEPTWSRNTAAAAAASITTNELRTFVVDPFSPGYRGLGSAINGFCVSGDTIYKVTDLFGTPAYTSLHTLTTTALGAAELTQIAASFGRFQATESDNPWIMVAYHAATGAAALRTYVVYSTDGGQTWSSEIDVSGQTRTQATREISRPAIWLSPRTPGLAYVGAWVSSGAEPPGGLFVTEDWGATWAAATAIDDQGVDMGLGFAMHVPWLNNASEEIAYYGAFNETSNIFNYGLWRSVGGTATDISPVDSGVKYGPVRGLFGVRALDTNRQHLLLAGAKDNVDDVALGAAGSDGYTALWKSSNAGDTWTRVTSDVLADGSAQCILQAAFSADNPNVFYAWGDRGYFLYTEDGSTMDNKSPVALSTGAEIMAIFGGSAS